MIIKQGDKNSTKLMTLALASKEANNFVINEIGAVINRIIANPKGLPALRKRIIVLAKAIKKGAIDYETKGFYMRGHEEIVLHSRFNPKTQKATLYVFAPALQKFIKQLERSKFRALDIEFIIGAIYAHEEMHFERFLVHSEAKDKPSVRLNISDEAEIWGKTILEIIRPGLKAGYRLPKNFIKYSEKLKYFKDNYKHPGFVKMFGGSSVRA